MIKPGYVPAVVQAAQRHSTTTADRPQVALEVAGEAYRRAIFAGEDHEDAVIKAREALGERARLGQVYGARYLAGS